MTIPLQPREALRNGRFIPGESPLPPALKDFAQDDWFWGRGEFAQRAQKWIQLAAESQVHVLVIGETGTGKEIIAKHIHNRRKKIRSLNATDAPFVAVNCGALPESLAESILFGHERGAFTSARERQSGRFEVAKQGTLFLDEIQALTPSCQAKLLRVIQHREYERLGAKSTLSVDCQIVAASGIPLEILVERGEFRRDLYYRLNVCPIYLPPLRKRTDDFEGIAQGLLMRISSQLQRPTQNWTLDTLETLKSYTWPGNIRELEHALLYACLRSKGTFESKSLPPYLTGELTHYLSEGIWK